MRSVTEVETDCIAATRIINGIVLDTMRVCDDTADVVGGGSVTETADSYIGTGCNAAGLFALSIAKQRHIVAVGDSSAAAAVIVERAADDA